MVIGNEAALRGASSATSSVPAEPAQKDVVEDLVNHVLESLSPIAKDIPRQANPYHPTTIDPLPPKKAQHHHAHFQRERQIMHNEEGKCD